MGKIIQIKVDRDDLQKAVEEAIVRKVGDVIRKQHVDEEIRMSIKDAVVDIDIPDVKLKIAQLEQRILLLEERAR